MYLRTVVILTYLLLIQGLMLLPVGAQTELSGTCSGTFTVADSPLMLTGNCTVPAGETLNLEAGVEFASASSRILSIDGTLNATEVTFTNIQLNYRAGSSGMLQNSTLSHNRLPLRLSGNAADNPIAPVFMGNTISAVGDIRFVTAAIVVEGTSQPVVMNNTIISDRTGVLYGDDAAGTLTGNTITGRSFGVNVLERAQPRITNNTITSRTRDGIRYEDTAGGEARNNTTSFLQGENTGNRAGIAVNENASPLLDGNTLGDDPTQDDHGLRFLVAPGSTVTATNNRICATGDDSPIVVFPRLFELAANATIADNSLICDQDLSVEITSGSIQGDAVLQPLNGISRFLLTTTLQVDPAVTLTIPAGITVVARGNSITTNGTLEVDDSTFFNTRFTFRSGSSGTVRNSRLFSAAGFAATQISVTDATVTLQDSLIDNISGSRVLFPILPAIGMATVMATGNTFRGNNVVFDLSASSTIRATIANNVFDANVHALTFVSGVPDDPSALFTSFPQQFDTNTFIGRADQNTIQIPGMLNVTGTIQAAPVPYACHRQTVISPGVTITLQPGTVIQGDRNCTWLVNGELQAVGTPARPIIFTAAQPETGTRWRGLVFRDKALATTTSVLEHCVVQFAGALGANSPGILLDNASIPIRHCLITDNLFNGLDLMNGAAPVIEHSAIVQNIVHGIRSTSGSMPAISMSSIFSNGGNGIQNNDATVVINAEDNFWGADSGPRDLATDRRCNTLANPDGLGEEVSDCVDFDPWLRLGPSMEGIITPISGSGQEGEAGTILPSPLIVEIRSLLDTPLEDIEVIFSVVQGDAMIVETQPVLTGANGRASAMVQLGLTPGEVRIVATARDVNSPLATFMGASNAPTLFIVQTTGRCSPTGDVNEDGQITPRDAWSVLRHFLGFLPLSVFLQECADVVTSAPGTEPHLTPADAVCIMQRFLGQSSCFDLSTYERK